MSQAGHNGSLLPVLWAVCLTGLKAGVRMARLGFSQDFHRVWFYPIRECIGGSVVRKYVYSFGGGKADGDASMKELLGGKGANLAEMTNIGLPVPPGFTISTEVCDHYNKNGGKYPEGNILL